MSNNDNTVQKNNIKNEKEKVTNIWKLEVSPNISALYLKYT